MRGRLIRTLVNEEKNPGNYSVHWDGRDTKDQDVGSGVYIYRIVAGDFLLTKKMVIIR
jgi:flagellar hook assembly protein FlgD